MPFPPAALEPLPIASVELAAGPWRSRFWRNLDYLFSLENEAFLEAFHWTAAPEGLSPPQPRVRWGGWMGTTHDGEFHGHYLSACARAIAISADEPLAAKSEALVAALARYQQPSGALWVGAVTEQALDGLRAGQLSSIPYYTLHKLLMGLFELGTLAGNEQALEMSVRLADYIAAGVNPLSADQVATVLTQEHGGIAEAMLDVAALTEQPQHMEAGLKLLDRSVIDPLARGEDILTGRHANTTIPILHGAARAYELTGAPAYRRAVESFWDIVVTSRYLATGADANNREYWQQQDALEATLSASTQETCATYNWLRLAEYLFRWTGDPSYGDAYERGHVNGILAAQHPDTGMFVYFMPMRPGPRQPNPDNYDPDPPETGCKHFGRPHRSFWCCYGTGVQAFANPASAVFYRRGDTILIDQYVASVATTEVPGDARSEPLRIELRSELPHSETVTAVVRLRRPDRFALAFRVPWWVGDDASVSINFQPLPPEETGALAASTWLTLDRQWGEGDTVTLTYPMHLATESIRDDPRCAAVVYGPHVLAACANQPPELDVSRERPEEWLRADEEEPFSFVVDAAFGAEPLRFRPLSRILDEDYHVYLDFPR